ncbi:splicing factor Cactin-like [Penaeus indicus]|uniref:splicing factor Cactin-like n=1 Tax=Penaeus indicus TaxID=29960 RepID=UPI00300DAF38
MGSEKKKRYDRSRSRSRERRKYKRKSRSRSVSQEKQPRYHSHARSRSRSLTRRHDRSDYKRDRRSASRDRERDGAKAGSRQRHRSNSRGRERIRSKSRSRERMRSNSRGREMQMQRSLSTDRNTGNHRNHSRFKKKSRSSSEESVDRRREKSLSKERKHKKQKKKKKKYKKSSSSSSTSSESSDESTEDETKLLQRLTEERKRIKEKKVKEKVARKAMETPAEKRLRRLQKKEAKERKRKEKMGWDSEYLHFTNADNPYGDNNLLETFVWKKKLEKEGLATLPREEIEKQNRLKMDENRMELEKVKKRRQERELERQEREKMMELEQRQREAAQFSQFSKQEDQFQLEQARLRSQIRIQDGRAKPIDLLAQYVSSEGDVTAVDMHEPYTHLTGLTLVDLEDLLEDIRIYMQLEKENMNQTYWTDLTIIVQDELRRLRQRDTIEDATTHRQGIHAAVASDVSAVFQNKSLAELNKLQLTIEAKLSGPTTGLDVGYWESLLSQLKAHQARARLRERHRDNLKKKLEMLKAEQGVKEEEEEEDNIPEEADESEDSSSDEEPRREVKVKEEVEEDGNHSEHEAEESTKEKNKETEEEDDDEWDSGCEGDSAIHGAISLYNAGRYSPRLIKEKKLEPGTVVVDEAEDMQRILWARQRVVSAGQGVESVLSSEEKVMQKEAQRAMNDDEAQFSVEAKLDTQQYLWSDKYRPRKPRYFNRVHTGFEWNKYNQTHYDMDNPPPKIVQGYKFNIFYPDLIEKSRTPQYELIPCTDNKDFAILKFTAGPPYEDIAFKIVNREWEYSYKRGFRCQFHNNIFQLWFHFKRYRYRR